MSEKQKTVSCHLKLTRKTDEVLISFQERMANAGLRMSKANLAGYILENITTKELERISSRNVKERKKRQKIEEIFKNSGFTERIWI